jgi:uncharacterized membrane protein YgdD (TMEM256/DUF423 family)
MVTASQRWIAIGAALGAVGVALGAFSAHGLENWLSTFGYAGQDLSRRMENFETAVHYQMLHALGLVILGLALELRTNRWWRIAAWLFLVGIFLFSGLLKVLAIAGPEWRWLGRVVPIGGVCLIAGWVATAIGALKKS